MVRLGRFRPLAAVIFVIFTFTYPVVSAWANGFARLPNSPSREVQQNTLDRVPSDPMGLPGSTVGLEGGSNSILITPRLLEGIMPSIPNLQAGYLFTFGNSVGSGRLSLDYLLPIPVGSISTVFGEAHFNLQDFWKTLTGGANNRADLSFGGGYRTLLGSNKLVGVNAFYDTTRLGSRWYNSGGLGVEMAALVAGYDSIDLNFNWYGNLFNANVLANAFRRGPSNFDFQTGYSHELYAGGPDLRLHACGYRFSAGGGVYGWRAGAELKTRDGLFSVKYEAAHDRINGTYHSTGGFVNVRLQLERLFRSENPFVRPEPIFRSPRNLRRLLTQPVYREYYQPSSVVVSKSRDCDDPGGGPPCKDFNTITVSAPDGGNYKELIVGDNQFRPLRSGGAPDMHFGGGAVAVSSICPEGRARILVTLPNMNSSTVNPATGVQVVVLIGRNASNQFVLSRGSSRETMPGLSTRTFEIIAPNMQALLVSNNISPDNVRVRVRHTTEVPPGKPANRTFRVTPSGVVIQFNY